MSDNSKVGSKISAEVRELAARLRGLESEAWLEQLAKIERECN